MVVEYVVVCCCVFVVFVYCYYCVVFEWCCEKCVCFVCEMMFDEMLVEWFVVCDVVKVLL